MASALPPASPPAAPPGPAAPSAGSVAGRLRDAWPALGALAIAALLRYQVVEPVAIAHHCAPAPWHGWCALRTAVTTAFRHQEIGWVALAVSIAAVVAVAGNARQLARRLARAGLALGAVGLILYSYDPAAVAAVLAAVVLARRQPDGPGNPVAT